MEKQARSIVSGAIQNHTSDGDSARGLPAIMAHLFAATGTLNQSTGSSGDDTFSETRPQTPAQRVWYVARFLFLGVPVAMIASLLWVIWTRTANVPYWDEWETVLLEQHFKQGTISFHEIVMLHATAHRIIIPRLLDLALINLTNYNRQIEMTVDLGIAVLGAYLLFWCLRRTLGSLTWALVLAAPLSLFFFSFAQFGNWFAPFQVQFILAVFGSVCCVRAFAKDPVSRKGFALALAGAAIGSFSSLHGLVTWVAFLPGAVRGGVRKAAIWVGSAAVVWFLYFQHFPHSPTRISIHADIAYSLTYLGAPLGYPSPSNAQLAAEVSIVLLLGNIALYWLRHRNLWPIACWLQLALYVLGCTQATAQGRVSGGPYQALFSRYEAFAALWWVALLVIMALNVKESLPALRASAQRQIVVRVGVVGVNVVALALLVAYAIPVNQLGMQQALLWQDTQRANQYAIVDFQNASASCLELYYPWPDLLRPRVQFLQQEGMAIFSLADVAQPAGFDPRGTCQKPYHDYIDDLAGGAGGYVVSRAYYRALENRKPVLDG